MTGTRLRFNLVPDFKCVNLCSHIIFSPSFLKVFVDKYSEKTWPEVCADIFMLCLLFESIPLLGVLTQLAYASKSFQYSMGLSMLHCLKKSMKSRSSVHGKKCEELIP